MVLPFFLFQCPLTGQVLSFLGFSSVSQLTVEHLERICSGVLTQLLPPSCLNASSASLPPVHYSGELLHRAAGLFVRPPLAHILHRAVQSGVFYSHVRSAKSKISEVPLRTALSATGRVS